MDDRIDIDAFIASETERLQRFKTFYEAQAAAGVEGFTSLKLAEGDWVEQYNMWTEE
jgi:hypothetical protein